MNDFFKPEHAATIAGALSWMIWLVVTPVTSTAVATAGMVLCLFRGTRGDTASFVNHFLSRTHERRSRGLD